MHRSPVRPRLSPDAGVDPELPLVHGILPGLGLSLELMNLRRAACENGERLKKALSAGNPTPRTQALSVRFRAISQRLHGRR